MEGWELLKDIENVKENIQPLTVGRKMSVLAHTLDGTNHEKEFLERQSELEQQILEYNGPDELEPWIHYITFLEQACPNGGKMNAKYEAVLGRCCSNFFTNPKFSNDKRFIDIYLKGFQKVPLEKRTAFLKAALDRGFGSQVGQMYIAIATDLEALQNYPQASNILQKGIEAKAQPIETLIEALNNLQYRVAERLSKSLQQNHGNDGSMRNFGHSVPVCSTTNEAQNMRVALSPARGIHGTKPNTSKTDKRKIPLFEGVSAVTGEDDNENTKPQNLLTINPAYQQELIRNEQENNMKPKKWCDEVFSQPPISALINNQEKIQIYEEEPANQPRIETSRKINKGILSERKEDTSTSSSSSSNNNTATSNSNTYQKIMYRKDQLKKGNREITFDHLRAKDYLAKRGLTTVKALQCDFIKQVDSLSQVKQVEVTTVNSNAINSKQLAEEAILMTTRLEELKKTVQRLEDKEREDSEQILKQNKTIDQLNDMLNAIQVSKSKMENFLQTKINELERTIEQNEEELARVTRDNQELKVLLAAEMETSQRLVKDKEQMRLQFEEEKLKMQQNFDRERNESLLNFSQKLDKTRHDGDAPHSTTQTKPEERNYHQSNQLPIKSITSGNVSPLLFPGGHPIPSTQNFSPFSVYESKLEYTEFMDNNNENTFPKPFPRPIITATSNNNNNSSYMINNENECPQTITTTTATAPQQSHLSNINISCSNKGTIETFSSATENNHCMPPPPPPFPTTTVSTGIEEDKENLFQCPVGKPNRAKSGILQPSTTADPMELIFTEEEEEDEILKKQEETGQDFDISDLTRALQFYPRPMVNSTPEKLHSADTTIPDYVPRHPIRSTRKSSLFRTCEIRSGPFTQELSQPSHISNNQERIQSQQETQQQQNFQPSSTIGQDQLLADIQPIHYDDDEDGPNYPSTRESYSRRPYGRSFGHTENLPYNLSPIPETSKERWTSTSSSSSNNMTNTRAVNYSHSYNMTKSVPRPGGRFTGH